VSIAHSPGQRPLAFVSAEANARFTRVKAQSAGRSHSTNKAAALKADAGK